MRVLVAGATGFVGRRLAPALEDAGHEVVAMTRHPDTYEGPGSAVFGDVHDAGSLPAALDGVEAAYYLVHSLDSDDFVRRDAEAATAFGVAAAEAGLQRIVYLGGLGDDADDLSDHLRSRRQVEGLLSGGGVPVTTLRAGIVIGHGGISWEITRQLVEHLPAMVTPRWVSTRTQPIAVDDVIRYLVGVLTQPVGSDRAYEIGGPEVLEYVTMMRRVAEIEGRHPVIVPVPLLSPGLSARWLSLVTDVDSRAGRSLVDSMVNEVVVRDGAIREVVPFEPISYDDAVRRALAERAEQAEAAASATAPSEDGE
ncbi:NAD(P)H-binding protein [Mumia qirimensis]|uniref:NAD(P)H-binding protein n=1 Tax=Mumia qirimensis TaxID=3234852 RepID=UPI00351D5E4F